MNGNVCYAGPVTETEMPPRLLRIQEVAADTGLTARAIRYYEEVGLLAPAARSEGAYRLYDAEDLERLRFIRGLRDDAGFALAEIRQLLVDEEARARNRDRFRATTDATERRRILSDAIGIVDRQVATLRAKIDRLEAMVAEATERRSHLVSHLEDLDAGREPEHSHAAPRGGRTGARDDPPSEARPALLRRPCPALGGRAFRHRNYRLFFAGQLTSLVGTWMQTVAQSWLVLQLTGDPFMLGVVAAAQFLPVIFLGLFGGLIADALPKRKTLIGTQAAKMVLALALFGLVASSSVEVWQVVLLAALGGVTNVFDMPTRQAFSVEMVGREDIANAVALNSAMFNSARIIGPAVAGLTIGALGISTAFLIDAVSFLAVIAALFAMRDDELWSPPPMVRPGSVREVAAGVREGLGYVRSAPLVLLAISAVGLVATFGMNFPVIIPALARDVLHSDASGYGFLMAASGVGSLTAALAIAFSRRARPALVTTGGIVVGLAEILLALSGVFPLSLALMFLVGLGAISMAATANTTIQLAVPDHLRGRTMSIYVTVFAARPRRRIDDGRHRVALRRRGGAGRGRHRVHRDPAHGPRLAAERRRAGCDRGARGAGPRHPSGWRDQDGG